MGNKKATGFLCLRLVPCFAYVGAEDNRKGIPFVKIVSLLCKLIQFLMVALSVTVHKALILLVFLNHPYQSLAFGSLLGLSPGGAYWLVDHAKIETIVICNHKRIMRETFEKWYHSQSKYKIVKDCEV